MKPNPLRGLSCITQSALFNICLSDEDLRRLSAWEERPNRIGLSPSVLSRSAFHRACHHDGPLARSVADLLDIRHLDTILLVRDLDEVGLMCVVDQWIELGRGHELPGLLWALGSDDREAARVLGSRLCLEATFLSLPNLVAPATLQTTHQQES